MGSLHTGRRCRTVSCCGWFNKNNLTSTVPPKSGSTKMWLFSLQYLSFLLCGGALFIPFSPCFGSLLMDGLQSKSQFICKLIIGTLFFIFGQFTSFCLIDSLPIVLGMIPVAPFTANLPPNIPAKWVLFLGCILLMIANILLPFNTSPDTYWRFGLPGFLLGTIGAATIYSMTK